MSRSTLTVVQPTVIKLYPKQSSLLKSGQKWSRSPENQPLPVVKDEPHDDQHVKIEIDSSLASAFGNNTTLYVFKPHVLIKSQHQDPSESKSVTNLGRNQKDRGPSIDTPIGKVYLNDPVVDKAPNILVYELTHNGTRIPQTAEEWARAARTAITLQKLRDKHDEPIIITSWFRPRDHNARVGGAPNSRHIKCDAVDGYIESLSGTDLYRELDPQLDGGLALYGDGRLHIDTRGYVARWGQHNLGKA